MTEYYMEKSRWTSENFGEMAWHDVYIHAVAMAPDEYAFLLDVDYILKWVESPAHDAYSFWLSPATLVFENARDIKIAMETPSGDVSIYQLTRQDGVPTPKGNYTDWLWECELHEGSISLRATGYTLYLRQAPVLWNGQRFSTVERGGITFDRKSFFEK